MDSLFFRIIFFNLDFTVISIDHASWSPYMPPRTANSWFANFLTLHSSGYARFLFRSPGDKYNWKIIDSTLEECRSLRPISWIRTKLDLANISTSAHSLPISIAFWNFKLISYFVLIFGYKDILIKFTSNKCRLRPKSRSVFIARNNVHLSFSWPPY